MSSVWIDSTSGVSSTEVNWKRMKFVRMTNSLWQCDLYRLLVIIENHQNYSLLVHNKGICNHSIIPDKAKGAVHVRFIILRPAGMEKDRIRDTRGGGVNEGDAFQGGLEILKLGAHFQLKPQLKSLLFFFFLVLNNFAISFSSMIFF